MLIVSSIVYRQSRLLAVPFQTVEPGYIRSFSRLRSLSFACLASVLA